MEKSQQNDGKPLLGPSLYRCHPLEQCEWIFLLKAKKPVKSCTVTDSYFTTRLTKVFTTSTKTPFCWQTLFGWWMLALKRVNFFLIPFRYSCHSAEMLRLPWIHSKNSKIFLRCPRRARYENAATWFFESLRYFLGYPSLCYTFARFFQDV